MELQKPCEPIVEREHKTAPTQADGYPSIRTPKSGRGRFILDGVSHVAQETYRLQATFANHASEIPTP